MMQHQERGSCAAPPFRTIVRPRRSGSVSDPANARWSRRLTLERTGMRESQDKVSLNAALPISGNDSDDDLVAKLVRLFTKQGYNTHQDQEVLDSAHALLRKAGGKSLADRVAPLVR